ncbi:MAG TPA: Gfo/Idh/MocA family oxidoreductase, partial [Vicinamibacterales bacterium]
MEIRASRRQFLQAGAGAVGAAFAATHISLDAEPLGDNARQVPASDRVRFGIIGVGMEGSGLLARAVMLPGVECAAASDLYDGRHARAREIAGASLRTTRRYQELLDDKEIDCIVAAVPDHWHRQVVVDAVSAGKDIYCEKPMSHTVADGRAMVAAAKKSGRIVQIGAQRTSSVLCAKARELVAGGILGDLQLVEGSLGRNDPTGAWVYPPPPDLSPTTLDWDTWQGDVPKRAFDPNIFARWRCWKEYGTGVAGDLMVHLISGMMFTWGINEAPRRVTAMGGIRRFNDGRNMPDVHMSLFEYGSVPVYIRLNLGSASPETLRFFGSKGILELTETGLTFASQPGVDLGPSYYAGSFPQTLRSTYEHQWHLEHDPKPGEEPLYDGTSYVGDSYDDTRPHLWKFFQAVKTRQPVVQDA